jgi:aryl-alcohol dehydrogenase-like predicted oxidoreductase
MKNHPLGNTGMNVSEIGHGAWQLANPDWRVSDRNEALKIVQAALEAGCNFFDTAPGYGGGRSEELIGQGLKSVRRDIVISTKFRHTAEGATDFQPESIRPSLEASMKRLQTDYLDIVLMHNPPREMMDGRVAQLAYGMIPGHSFNKKSPLFTTPSRITFTASDCNSLSNENVFRRACVVRTEGSRKSPNGRDVRYNW